MRPKPIRAVLDGHPALQFKRTPHNSQRFGIGNGSKLQLLKAQFPVFGIVTFAVLRPKEHLTGLHEIIVTIGIRQGGAGVVQQERGCQSGQDCNAGKDDQESPGDSRHQRARLRAVGAVSTLPRALLQQQPANGSPKPVVKHV